MIHFKNNAGFTLIEAILAIAIVSIVLSPLFVLQGTLVRAIGRQSSEIERLFLAEQYMIKSHHEVTDVTKPYSTKKSLEDPPITLTYIFNPLSQDVIAQRFKDMRHQVVRVTWYDNGIKRSDEFVTFIFEPEK